MPYAPCAIVICVYSKIEVNINISFDGLGVVIIETHWSIVSRSMKTRPTTEYIYMFFGYGNAVVCAAKQSSVFLSTILECPNGPKWTFCHVVRAIELSRRPRWNCTLNFYSLHNEIPDRPSLPFVVFRRKMQKEKKPLKMMEKKRRTFHLSAACGRSSQRRHSSYVMVRRHFSAISFFFLNTFPMELLLQ